MLYRTPKDYFKLIPYNASMDIKSLAERSLKDST
jgi:hypothetical protein